MELFKRAINESNIKAQIKTDLIKHLEACRCGEDVSKPKKTKKTGPNLKFGEKLKGL